MKQLMQQRSGGIALTGAAIGFFDLSGDFVFADDKRIEAAGHAEQMPLGVSLLFQIKFVEHAAGHVPFEVLHLRDEQAGGGAGVRRDRVKFRAVAGRKNGKFLDFRGAAQQKQRFHHLVAIQRKLL